MPNQIRVVSNRFPEIAAQLASGAGKAVQETSTAIAATARSLAPKLTGTLAGSIEVQSTGPTSAEVTATAPYALYVEFGTGHGPAQPFMTPAGEQGRPLLTDAVQRNLIPGA